MRFALIKGQSQYGSLRLHIDQLAQALTAIGHEARIVDMAADDRQDQLNVVTFDPPDCFFTFSGGGHDLKIMDQSAYDFLGVAFASIYVDHPIHHYERLKTPIRKNIALFLDRSHLQFVRASPCAGNFSQLGFLPPGANELPEPPDLSDEAFAKRDIPLMFTGTYRGAPQAPWRQWPDSPARRIGESIVERMVADARLPVLEALRQALTQQGVALTPKIFDDAAPLAAGAQLFAEAYHRDAVLTALGAAGLPLHIWGNGWEPLAERYPSFVYGGVGSFAETLHTLRRARVVLNINNGFVAGGHERVFTAMCAGAAVFSDANRYYEEVFKDGREIVTFGWPKLASAPDQLAALVADTGRAGRIARAGAKRAQAEHRWTDRASGLVNAVRQAM
ncbi:glycosyltransferase [Phenylobacterium sp. LjRoot225]|uniref:glycosyltransferase family protein n=1 Tax=Phenylobacterium sp. LjRoot225 TaxID=3342285 RepID=UPI003ECF561A